MPDYTHHGDADWQKQTGVSRRIRPKEVTNGNGLDESSSRR
ncbi:hypothetical protein D3OALGA1CA_5341 [Olavius algarvensis associated proteobacterium Delta 3]|nr:hypothetical protein D3OALGB2SA_4942 [Olavius algarvensis associated proteobacterium Delta 3]CAB5165299.1 hypothetical protein D3OALGA1CA_5341 [Olavius algarvensis associated proteobacterium Delta 3]